ncbi:variable surface lipoprotein [Mycoplasmopsis bovis]|nr:variable surface lipoprotein [Mycoplasmopsis bovis]QQH77909.1 variable surface lipoprotein [Mycoplasmopsis bovis]
MNKKKLILIRGGVLFASSLPLIAASCKNNETKEPKKEPEMDTPIAQHTPPPLLILKNWSQSKWEKLRL